jgi:phage gpG-like protein
MRTWPELVILLEQAGSGGLSRAIGKGAGTLASIARNEARANAGGRVLQRRSGALQGSITTQIVADQQSLRVLLQAGSPRIRYARIQEEGGIVQGSPWLRFQVRPGEWRQVERVRIPARPYLRPALAVAEDAAADVLQGALAAVLEV